MLAMLVHKFKLNSFEWGVHCTLYRGQPNFSNFSKSKSVRATLFRLREYMHYIIRYSFLYVCNLLCDYKNDLLR